MATITTLNASDNGSVSRGVINTNFTNLNTDKIEAATTNTLTNKTIDGASNTLTNIAASSIGSGTLAAARGGTGVSNTGTITLGGNLTTSGAFTTTLTVTGNTNVTLPTTGTLVNTAVTSLASLTSAAALTTVGTLASGNATAIVDASSTSAAGKVELATSTEINTGTDTTRAMPVDQFVASNRNVRYIYIRVLASTTNCSVASTVGGDVEAPFTGTITEIGGWVDTAGTTGNMVVDVNKNGTTLMTTNKLSWDSTEKSTRTAATAPTLTTTAITAGDLITIDIDSIQTTPAKGLVVRLGIRMT